MLSTDRGDWTDLSALEVVGLLLILAVMVHLLLVTRGAAGIIIYPILFLSGLSLVYDGFNRWRGVRLVEDTAPEPVRSVAVGQTEVRGTVEPLDEPAPRPFSEGECVLAYWEVEEHDEEWETLAAGVRQVPFVVDDGTGAIRVDPPADATTRMSDRNSTELTTGAFTFVGKGGEPEPVVEFLRSRPDVGMPDEGALTRRQRRYTASVVPPGEEVYVFGGASVREDPDGSNPERLVLSEDDATGEFILSDRPPEEFVAADRSWAIREVAIGLLVVAGTLGGVAVQFPVV